MLEMLHIRDFALVKELSVEFRPGLNIISGETGAGKSILVGALGLVLGERKGPFVHYSLDQGGLEDYRNRLQETLGDYFASG